MTKIEDHFTILQCCCNINEFILERTPTSVKNVNSKRFYCSQHLQELHAICTEKKPCKCEECHNYYGNYENFKRHKTPHTGGKNPASVNSASLKNVERGFLILQHFRNIKPLIPERNHTGVNYVTKSFVIMQPLGDTRQFILERNPTHVQMFFHFFIPYRTSNNSLWRQSLQVRSLWQMFYLLFTPLKVSKKKNQSEENLYQYREWGKAFVNFYGFIEHKVIHTEKNLTKFLKFTLLQLLNVFWKTSNDWF